MYAAAIEKMLRDVVSEEIALQKETIDWVAECAVEFVHVLGDKANHVAATEAKREKYRVNPEHVLQVLKDMEKVDYAKKVTESTEESKKASRKQPPPKLSHEELLAEQNALFKEASRQATKQGW